MAGEAKNSKTISKTDTGFPAWLDFDQLRRESITYLGKLSGKIWTDHNVHDPGITILEALCYAILDLGYRTNLPAEDVLARNPAETGKDNNFFTPAEILSCNPLTITDFRKLLIDVEGVRNAWLEPATNVRDICRLKVAGTDAISYQPGIGQRLPFLNGLYHVYIELETYPDTNENLNEYAKETLERVKAALMAHRNLCEDFVGIFILCRLQTGVCANIELEEGADAEQVYKAAAEKLNEFFSPAPKFYTLQQLLDQRLPIEDIFAGRPYRQSSYGFTITGELEAIQLRREIHLSDVYNVLFGVPGVKKISALNLRTCEANGKSQLYSGWKFAIPENYIPAFSPSCSGFTFTRNGLKVDVDTEKFASLFALNFSHSGRTPYTIGSPYLDLPVPQGVYSEELDDYYSVQNDFPEVYGIGEGQLSTTASTSRRARAYQLKGYLLFFDQLLANYLSQLKHIRDLFALSAPATAAARHTYFLNTLETVPEMEMLLRFSPDDSGAIGSPGSALVFPVAQTDWEKLLQEPCNSNDLAASLPPFTWNTRSELENVQQLQRNDFLTAGEAAIVTAQTADGYWCYCITGTAPGYVLLCRKTFETKESALAHAAAVKYIGLHENNYRGFTAPNEAFSFDIVFNLTSYTDYLQLLVEDENLYRSRRKDFLDHLLARFAEKFSDFALLNWNDSRAIPVVENYLSRYDDLSRNRGRAFDYQANGFNTKNVSGFEQKIKALAGLQTRTAALCHFVVEPCDEYFIANIRAGNKTLFATAEKFDSRAEGEAAATAMVRAMTRIEAYGVHYVSHQKNYELRLHYGHAIPAVHPDTFTHSGDAEKLSAYLVRLAQPKPPATDIAVSDYRWWAELRNYKNEPVARSLNSWEHDTEVHAAFSTLARKTGDAKLWNPLNGSTGKTLHAEALSGNNWRLIDTAAFKLDVNDTVLGKPGKFTYDVLDQQHTFKLTPHTELDSAKAARDHCYRVLVAAADLQNWQVTKHERARQYRIEVCVNGTPQAHAVSLYDDEVSALANMHRAHELVLEHSYSLATDRYAHRWKFYYTLGYTEADTWRYESEADFNTHEEAEKAAELFHAQLAAVNVKAEKQTVAIRATGNKNIPALVPYREERDRKHDEKNLAVLLQQHKDVRLLYAQAAQNQLAQYVQPENPTGKPGFLYRLVDRERIPARSKQGFGEKNDAQLLKRKLAAEYKQQKPVQLGCLVVSEEDGFGITRYRYILQLENLWLKEQAAPLPELNLFGSLAVYNSWEEAKQALASDLPALLRFALDKASYGKQILLQPPTAAAPAEARVAIVPETAALLQKLYGTAWIDMLIALVNQYPVKQVRYGSKEFAALFCTEPEPEDADCKTRSETWVFYFEYGLQQPVAGLTDTQWISTQWFACHAEAVQEFRFFNWLLGYAGNWFIDCDICAVNNSAVYRFFIYEVLAESVNCFAKPEEAWGEFGVEAFICAVQSGKGIHQHQRLADCCYSLYVTCGEGIVTHPCTYDTPKHRDAAMNDLYLQFRELADKKAFAVSASEKGILINNRNGEPLAQLDIQRAEAGDANDACDRIIVFAEYLLSGKARWEGDGGDYRLMDANNKPFATTPGKLTHITGLQWLHMLTEWACFYPIRRTKTGEIKTYNAAGLPVTEPVYKYCVELQLPGFSHCGTDEPADRPCTCEEPVPTRETACHIAWKAPCCFATCIEAMRTLAYAYRLLADFKNYHPVFDCTCGNYGIALHATAALPVEKDIRVNELPGTRLQAAGFLNGSVIAFNPQCYETPNAVCDAADRVRERTNAAGLHVVEHILLRPHCMEDCACKERNNYCDPYYNCNFPDFPADSDDPCETATDIPFRPGTDPYSFIATVVLPAWPALLRDAGKRAQAERIIYSEAPAHVLLRILWLRPADFCRFESGFKEWRKWLAGMPACRSGFSVCEFLETVFYKEYTCLDDCGICTACTDPTTGGTGNCADERKKLPGRNQLSGTQNDYDFLNLVNDVYCLGHYRCGETRIIVVHDDIPRIPVTATPTEPVKAAAAAAKRATAKKPATTAPLPATSNQQPVTSNQPATGNQPATKKKAQFVNSRYKNYVQLVESVQERTRNNPLAAKTRIFVQSAEPASDKLAALAKEIIGNAKPSARGAKTLNRNETLDLLQAVVCHYLDKISFNGKQAEHFSALTPALALLKKAKIDLQAIYNYWDAAGISVYEPELDIPFIKKLLTGSKK